MSRPFATVSVDVDPVDLHLLGYGHRHLPPDPLVYHAAVPRLLEIFRRIGIAATFFVVGRDAAIALELLRALVAAGHEVASHSQTHPFAFASLPPEAMRHELTDSRRALEHASGRPVVGFRAPNFDMDANALGALAECGYRYDASGFPSAFLLPARVLLAAKSSSLDPLLRLRAWPLTWSRVPYRQVIAGATVDEFPLSVTPGARFPVYHTARYLMGDRRFASTLDRIACRGEPLSYALHAVDALGLGEDRVDPRLARHPGMERPLADKLALLEASLAAIAERFAPMTFAARLATTSA